MTRFKRPGCFLVLGIEPVLDANANALKQETPTNDPQSARTKGANARSKRPELQNVWEFLDIQIQGRGITRGFSNHSCDTFGNPSYEQSSLWG